MKKFKYIFLVLFCVVFLSGCVKNHTTIGIDKDKSMTYENEILFSNELGDDMTTMLDSESYEKDGYKVTVVKEDGYQGIKVTKKFNNIDDYSNNKGEEVIISNFLNNDFDKSIMFKKKSGFLKDTYTAKFKYSIDTSEYNELEENNTSENITTNDESSLENTDEDSIENDISSENMNDYINLMGEMEFTFKVNLPYKAISNNATESKSDGKSLIWNLGVDSASNIEFEFSIYNMTNILILGGSIIAVIIILIVLIIVLKKKKSSKKTLIHKDYDPSIEGIINNDNSQVINNQVNNVENQVQNIVEPTVTQPQVEQVPVSSPVVNQTAEVQNINNNQNIQ